MLPSRLHGGLLALALLAAAPNVLAQPAEAPPPDEPAPLEPAPIEPAPAAPEPPPREEPAPEPPPKPEGDAKAEVAAKADAAETRADGRPTKHEGRFEFGSYGRMIVATDARGGPGRDADIAMRGTRMDESNYVELELRREDWFPQTSTDTKVVATLAIVNPIFHYDADFDVQMAVRNLFFEEQNLGLEGLSAWVGSRMVRGDDLYLLDFWPLDNLNTLGAGASYRHEAGTGVQMHMGVTQPDSPFFRQTVVRPAPLNEFGAVPVELLDRQKFIGSLKLVHNQRFGDTSKPGPGIKGILYGEGHALPAGTREPRSGELEQLPSDGGFVVGAQFTGYTGERDSFFHAYFRYASGLAAYGQFATPGQLTLDKTTDGAHEFLAALGGNFEAGMFGIMLGSYVRSFRDASERLNFEDVDEAVVLVRPTLFIAKMAGISLEGAFELVQRGVITTPPGAEDPANAFPEGPMVARMWRIGVMPYISPAGDGHFVRPQIRFIYNVAFRDPEAQALYAPDHPFSRREVEHFVGLGAEWWFNSTSYGW